MVGPAYLVLVHVSNLLRAVASKVSRGTWLGECGDVMMQIRRYESSFILSNYSKHPVLIMGWSRVKVNGLLVQHSN